MADNGEWSIMEGDGLWRVADYGGWWIMKGGGEQCRAVDNGEKYCVYINSKQESMYAQYYCTHNTRKKGSICQTHSGEYQ